MSVQMVMWSQCAGGSRTCAAHHHVSTMPPACPGEMIMSAGETQRDLIEAILIVPFLDDWDVL